MKITEKQSELIERVKIETMMFTKSKLFIVLICIAATYGGCAFAEIQPNPIKWGYYTRVISVMICITASLAWVTINKEYE